MRIATLLNISLGLAACSTPIGDPPPSDGPAPSSAVVVDRPADGPRKVKGVPPGHYPPPGMCRLWHNGLPPGHQPPPARCESLIGHVPPGAFVLYNEAAWDSRYDWHRHERSHARSVPAIILRLIPERREE